ncbi:MAG: acyl carrier protein [Acidobacteriota bacterium]|nr:acyl carrier protein [Acidobacteriota bacterium]MDQ7087045.1 acyl carrier protein [Acidobacteriota bacterium]
MTEEAKIRQFLLDSYLMSEDEKVEDTDSFIEKGVLDSTGVLELVAFLEEEFSVKVLDDELTPENLDSIRLVADFVRRKRAESAA